MKTKSETPILETDVVIFPMQFGQNAQETALPKETENNLAQVNNSVEVDNSGRFARLKKSLRKRSVSIL